MTSTVLVIGAGMGGMAVAARLATYGLKVTVLEQSGTFGGKLAEVRHGDFVFDTGPSLLTIPAVYRDLFLSTGRALEDSVEIVDLDPAFRYRFPDGTVLEMPGVGVGRCATAIGDALGGPAGDQWRAFMARAADMWQVTRGPFMENSLDGMRTLLRLARQVRDVRTIAPGTSLRALAEQYLTDPRLIMLVDRYATYTGSDPRRAPAALATIPYVEQVFGAYHIAGGLRRLGEALYQRCIERGVEFHFDTDVARIEVDLRGHATGVTLTSGRRLTSDVVIANADATHVYQDLLAHASREFVRVPSRSLARTTPSLSGVSLLLAVDGTTSGLRHHNVWFAEDYDDEFDSVFASGRPRRARAVPAPTIYACIPNDPSMRPDSSESWFVLVNAPRHGTDPRDSSVINWDEPGMAEAYAQTLLDVLARRGVDLRERVRWHQVRSPADLARHTRAPGGAIYGTSSNGTRAAFLRPANRTPIRGLYLVGGSAHPGGGLPLVGMSAQIVSELVVSDLPAHA